MNKTEFKKSFPFFSAYLGDSVSNYVGKDANLKHNYKTERGYLNHLKEAEENYQQVFTTPDLERIEVSIEWKRSRTWGNCPTAEMRAWDKNGNFYMHKAHAGGCGYDKGSTVLAECLNTCIRGMLYRKRKAIQSKKIKTPYGLNSWLNCEGGIGIDCYSEIAKFLGGKMTWKAGRSWDYIEFVF